VNGEHGRISSMHEQRKEQEGWQEHSQPFSFAIPFSTPVVPQQFSN
jgi:hypothetical protein